ncbi:neural cell adhesion molecule 1-like isoform X2 [Dreissena polymorpha]|uniref:neural cell adhesion molecule 1-like isoform X2 n=1 Tax=Dreissena polymorpha TaxID=45954 RepID=UPI002264790E|nr:neural cell adhesion molecule 1-like isoform X2 [Dreissena polymorpha]
MDNRLPYSWIILCVLLSTKGTIRISSYIVAPNKFNITCQWTGLATNIIFFRQTQIYPSASGELSRFDHVLEVQEPENECIVQSSLTVACVCIKYTAVSCIMSNTLEEHLILQWQCAVVINGKMTESNITTLKTYEPAKITAFQVDAFEGVSNVALKENSTAMLTCISEGFPTPEISLIKGETLAFGVSIVQSEISIRGQLNKTFTNVNRQMTGKYACVASNKHGQSAQSLYLNILYPPSVIRTDNLYIKEGESLNITCTYEPDQPIVQRFSLEQFDDNLNVTVSENDSVVFNCIAEGFPSPDMRLLKDSVKLAEFNGKSQGNTTTRLRHAMPSAGRQDMGQYTCVASNTIGLGGKEMFLNVLFPASRKIPIKDFSNNGNEANIYLGGEVTFSFSALANPLPTSAEYVWHKCSDTNICTIIANSSRSYIETYREISNLTVVNITESDYGMYILQVGNGIGKPHTEVYFLKRLSSLPIKPITSVSHIGLISAGLSVVFILIVIFVVACVHRHLRRRETIGQDVGYLFVVPTTPYYNDTTAQPPVVPWDRLDVQGEAIALSSSLPAENVDVQSEIYSEIDPQQVEDIISRDDGATNEAQLMTEHIRYKDVGPPEQDDEPQYIYGRCGH